MADYTRWIAALAQKNPLVALVVSLLIAITFTALAVRVVYNDSKNKDVTCETRLEAKDMRIKYLEEDNAKLNQMLRDNQTAYYNQKRQDDSAALAKLEELNDELQGKVREQRVVNQLQKQNIDTRAKVIKTNESIQKRNEHKINELKNELKK